MPCHPPLLVTASRDLEGYERINEHSKQLLPPKQSYLRHHMECAGALADCLRACTDEREATPPLGPSLKHNARPHTPSAKSPEHDELDDTESVAEAIAGSGSEQKVVLVLQTKSGAKQTVRLPHDAPFGRLFDKYGQLEKSLPKGKHARFLLDGEALLPGQTPEDLDIEDGTVIDVHW